MLSIYGTCGSTAQKSHDGVFEDNDGAFEVYAKVAIFVLKMQQQAWEGILQLPRPC